MESRKDKIPRLLQNNPYLRASDYSLDEDDSGCIYDEGVVDLPKIGSWASEVYNYDQVINSDNPLLSNKGTPSALEKHKEEMWKMY